MGGSASSQSTEGGDNRSNTQANYGLVNFANESFNQPQFNFIEILTLVMIARQLFIASGYGVRGEGLRSWRI